jgi:hypothetical protein
MRGIFEFPAESAEIADRLAEREGFELEVPVNKHLDDSSW